jgi:type VI protein secretion system component Hcp
MSNHSSGAHAQSPINPLLPNIRDLLDIDQLVLGNDMDMLLEVKPKGGGTPLKGEGRSAAGLASPSIVLGFRWGQGRQPGDTQVNLTTLGARAVSDLFIVKEVDSATAGLAGLCGSNKGVESATIVCLKDAGSQQEYFRIVASDGGVRNHTIFTSARHNCVLEAFQVTFKTLKISYLPQTGKGSMGGVTQYELNIPSA